MSQENMKCLLFILLLLASCSFNETEKLAEQLVSDTDFSYAPIDTPETEKIEPAVEANVEEQNETEVNATAENANLDEEIIITQTEINETIEINETENQTTLNQTIQQNTTNDTINISVNSAEKRLPLNYFFNLFNEKIKSYQFVYKGNQYFVRGTKYKIILWRPAVIQDAKWSNGTKRNAFYYDTIYVDRTQKTATAYCEGYKSEVNKKCAELGLYELAYELSFDKNSILLPEDWLYSYLNREPLLFEENKYEIGSRSTIMFAFNDSFITELNFDQKTGLVVRADQKNEANLFARYDYEDLAVNTVRGVDVIHRKKEDIPASDAFYRVV